MDSCALDSPSLQIRLYCVATHRGTEQSLDNQGDKEHSGDGDELVDILGAEAVHVLGNVRGVGSYMDWRTSCPLLMIVFLF